MRAFRAPARTSPQPAKTWHTGDPDIGTPRSFSRQKQKRLAQDDDFSALAGRVPHWISEPLSLDHKDEAARTEACKAGGMRDDRRRAARARGRISLSYRG